MLLLINSNNFYWLLVGSSKSSYSSDWLKKAYQRAKQQAQEEGRSLEEIVAHRYGVCSTTRFQCFHILTIRALLCGTFLILVSIFYIICQSVEKLESMIKEGEQR